jgi:hypothetical protein
MEHFHRAGVVPPLSAPCFRRLGAVGFVTPSLAQQRFKGLDRRIADPYFSNAPAKRYRA